MSEVYLNLLLVSLSEVLYLRKRDFTLNQFTLRLNLIQRSVPLITCEKIARHTD